MASFPPLTKTELGDMLGKCRMLLHLLLEANGQGQPYRNQLFSQRFYSAASEGYPVFSLLHFATASVVALWAELVGRNISAVMELRVYLDGAPQIDLPIP